MTFCRRSFLLVASLSLLVLATPALADENRLELTTERVVVFKDGYCLVVKKAAGTSNEAGEVFTEEVPDAAVLGSFWATPEEGRLLSTVAGIVKTTTETVEQRTCAHYLDLLVANEGKTASIDLDDGTRISGTIRRVLTTPQVAAPAQPWGAYSFGAAPRELVRTESTVTGSLFTLATAEGDVVLGIHRIRQMVVDEMELEIERTVTETRTDKRLTFRFEGGAAERTLHIIYFRPGVRWVPTYRVSLAAEGADRRARVSLQAELLNEAEDLIDVPIDVVVGVPNFRFKDVVSPFVLEHAMRNALMQAAPQLMSQAGSNGFFVNQTGDIGSGGAASAGSVDVPDEIVAGAMQDLFVYSLPRMTLHRGERAAVPVFDADVGYRDVYTWDLALQRKDIEASPSGGDASPLELSRNKVWHQIELINGTELPWTTGAALIMEGHQPLAQELLTYTSPGGRVRVPLTVAVDVRGSYGEQETGRELDALEWLRETYARLDKVGKLSIANSKRTPIDIEVNCHLGGHADSATHDGKITLGSFESSDWAGYVGHPAVNNHSVVTFVLELGAGETVTPEIAYHYFTRR